MRFGTKKCFYFGVYGVGIMNTCLFISGVFIDTPYEKVVADTGALASLISFVYIVTQLLSVVFVGVNSRLPTFTA
jgi:hypothetical protein